MNEIQAVLGLVLLNYIQDEWEKRRLLIKKYRQYLDAIPGINMLKESPQIRNSNQYFVVLIDETEFGLSRDAVHERYVENNPVRTGMVKKAEDYRWSSAREHIDAAPEVVSSNCFLLQEIRNWRKFLSAREDTAMAQEIRESSMTGRPCGDESFIEKLEKRFGRRLKAMPRGRPKMV